jgi:hypothetical protein
MKAHLLSAHAHNRVVDSTIGIIDYDATATDRSELGSHMYFVVEFVPVIESSKLVTIEVESRSQRHYIIDYLSPWHMHHYHYAATASTCAGGMFKSACATLL